jgi:transformation/transcription domain-associated protein
MIPLAPHIRMVQDDPSYITLQGVYEDHCRKSGVSKDEPLLFTMEKLRALADTKVICSARVDAVFKLTLLSRNLQIKI